MYLRHCGKKCFIDNFASTLFPLILKLSLLFFGMPILHVPSFWLEVTSNFKYSSFSDDSVCKMDVLCIQVPASGKTYLEK